MKISYLLSFFIIAAQYSTSADACSAIQLCSKDLCKMGYSMEWPVWSSQTDPSPSLSKYLVGGLFTQNSGIKKVSALGENSLQWTSKYKSLIVSQFGPHFGFNGVNEVGLEVYLLGPPALIKDSRVLPKISELDLLPLLLDTAKDVAEAIQILEGVSVQQLMFPSQIFIKDSNNKTAVIDFKKNLRVHNPVPKEEFVTNIWYDRQMELVQSEEPFGMDVRHLIFGDTKNFKQFATSTTEVGDTKYTQWQTLISKNKNSWSMRIATLPIDSGFYGNVLQLEKSSLIDLKAFFKKENFPVTSQFSFLQEIKKGKPLKWNSLTSEHLRLFQQANFQVVQQNQDQLFSRNEDEIDSSKETLAKMLKQLKTKPIEYLQEN